MDGGIEMKKRGVDGGIEMKKRVDVDNHLAEYLWRAQCDVSRSTAFAEAVVLTTACPYF